jgi:hypothetical protein
MTSKIRIKIGQIEVEYEGSEEFTKQELLGLIQTMSDLCKTTIPTPLATAGSPTSTPSTAASPQQPVGQISIGNIAAKLKCKKGPDLVLAAAASLALVKNKDCFTRQEILEEMKAATGYYKATLVSNLTVSLNSLIRSNKLLERPSGEYALHANARNELESQLAN